MKILKKWQYDFILSLCLLGFVVICILYAIFLESPRVKLLLARPDMYLAMWLIILGGLSIVLLFRSLAERKTQTGQEIPARIWNPIALFTVIDLVIYLLVLKKIGYIIDSFLLCWSLSIVYSFFEKPRAKEELFNDKKKLLLVLLKTFLFSVICSGLSYVIFTQVLNTRLPKFSLF